MIGAVSATAVLAGGAAAGAQAPATSTVRGVAPSAVPPTKSQFTSVKLRVGARGAAVSHLQERLNARGASLTVDGVFGSATLRAVKNQQSRAGIGVDGVVGPKTWGALTGTASTAPSTSQPKLRLGSRGAAVTTLQKQLNASGASLRVDGVFGSATASAVRALQSSARISVDAVVGPNTWSALGKGLSIGSGGTSAPSAPPASVGHPKLRQGDRGAAVKTLQSELNASGASIAVDGVFGSGTASAVRALQSAAGIGVDGVVGPKTWNALDSDVRISTGSGGRDDDRGSVGDSARGQAIIDAARTQLGARYTWGGESPGTGFDCSGLVHFAYNQAGVDLPRKTAKGYVFGGRIIPKSQARPGDLVAFPGNDYGHMGIYVGNGKIIDASGSRQQVVERSIWNSPHVFVTYR